MPDISEIVESDEVYEDAKSDVSSTNPSGTNVPATDASGKTTNSQFEAVDKVIKEQTKLGIEDGAEADTLASSSNTNKTEDESPPEYISEEINEDELKEKEKSMSPQELEVNKEKANQMKLEANELFKNDKSEEAIEMYTEALKICPLYATKERAVLFGNRAAAKIKLGSKKNCC